MVSLAFSHSAASREHALCDTQLTLPFYSMALFLGGDGVWRQHKLSGQTLRLVGVASEKHRRGSLSPTLLRCEGLLSVYDSRWFYLNGVVKLLVPSLILCRAPGRLAHRVARTPWPARGRTV